MEQTQTWNRSALARATARATARVRRVVERFGATVDVVADRNDAEAWDRHMRERSAQISASLDGLRPQEGFGRRTA